VYWLIVEASVAYHRYLAGLLVTGLLICEQKLESWRKYF